MLSSIFGAQHNVSRLNSELSRKAGSLTASVPRHSTDVAGVAGGGAAGAAGNAAGKTAVGTSGAAPAGGLPADPLLQPGVLEAVNMKVSGKAVRVKLQQACRHQCRHTGAWREKCASPLGSSSR